MGYLGYIRQDGIVRSPETLLNEQEQPSFHREDSKKKEGEKKKSMIIMINMLRQYNSLKKSNDFMGNAKEAAEHKTSIIFRRSIINCS